MKSLLIGIVFFSICGLHAQIDVATFTTAGAGYNTAVVNDYQCLGINPSNLGWKKSRFDINIGAGEFGFSIYSEPLKRALVKELFNEDLTFTAADRAKAVSNFTNSKLQITGEALLFGASIQDDKIGGIGFSVKEKMMWNSNLNETSSEFLFFGYNAPYFDSLAVNFNGDTIGYATQAMKLVSELFEGTSLSLLWYREYSLGYGRNLFSAPDFTLYGGVGLKYIKGFGVFDYKYDNNGNLLAYSALNPVFEVDYDTPSPSLIEGNDYQSVGNGFGFDVGLSCLIHNKFRVAAALNEIGSITWNGNVYEGEDGLLENIETAGINNYNIFEEGQNIAVENTNWGTWIGLAEKTVQLPMRFRGGAAYIHDHRLELGTDIIVPLNSEPGSFDKTVFGMGGRYFATNWLRCSAGMVTGGKFGTGFPVGISFFPFNNNHFMWELGLAINDISTYFSQNKPTVSLAMGLMRFSFGNIRNTENNIEVND